MPADLPPPVIRLEQVLAPSRSLVNVSDGSKKCVSEQIANLVVRELPEPDIRVIFENLVTREKLGSTGFSNGTATLHCRLSGCQNPISAVLHLGTPVGFDALDGAPVDLLSVLLTPEAATEEHLELLRQIVAMLDRTDVHDHLCSAPTAKALCQIVVGV